MNEKCTVKPTEGNSTPQYKNKLLYEHRPAEEHIPNYGLLKIKKNAQCPLRAYNAASCTSVP